MHSNKKIRIRRYTYGVIPYCIEAVVTFVGQNISVTIGGGDTYHIGAVAIATPSESIIKAGQTTITTSVMTVLGHKDDILAKDIAIKLAKHFGTTVSVTAGVHIDGADISDIEKLVINCNHLVEQIIQN